ncbi:MAG TPA: ribbon-helix-helix domain-containing protein [Rubrivivax sp.]|jgi:metal-responsive CopG/Arc/MetJ family transcriptional regulator|nr:ribbon-helix-helix domain-containing protein [Rubrivivax sp.]
MARTIIDIPDPQLREIDELCRLLGISRAEAVRRALRDFSQRNGNVKTDAFGLWAPAHEGTPSRRKTAAPTP